MTDFAMFWALYPRKVAKKDAETAWKKLTPEQQAKAVEAVPKHAEQWTDANFIPYPATWLNGERWEDVLERPILKQAIPAWWCSDEGILRRGRELGLQPKAGETWPKFKERVGEADKMSRATRAA